MMFMDAQQFGWVELGRQTWSFVGANPAHAVPVGGRPARERRTLDEQEMQAILRQARTHAAPWVYPALLIMSAYGLRVGELVRLTWSSIVEGKYGLHPGYIDVEKRKNGLPLRLPLYRPVLDALPTRGAPTARVFPNYQAVKHMVRALAVEAGISDPQSVSPHCLRHGLAAALEAAGADLRTVQTALGHSSLQSTER